ncbi:MAG TPA: hypothetical protein VH394_03140 [Thermoanaerobaculia bacterium]|jgi:hypothetical protein|nr:hypothetical protein [Thermoanaerobaculia bacterium]
MPNQVPRRLIGYGAYNLCFDSQLGKSATDSRNFFDVLKGDGWPVNLVKVICFRKSTIEGLPLSRAISLYKPDRTINPLFLDNLVKLVDYAAGKDFWVQVCIFHYHAVKDPNESPENIPGELQPNFNTSLCDRLKKFFTASSNNITQKQKELVAQLGQRLAGRPNVIWELANEVRMDGTGCTSADNSNLVAWLSHMRDALINNTGPDIHVGTSTGIDNEQVTGRNLPATFFDFHSGQWSALGDYSFGIRTSKERAASYNSSAFLIINDDGVPDAQRTGANITNWATAAFQRGLHYATKSTYPPGQAFSTHTLNALKLSNNNTP